MFKKKNDAFKKTSKRRSDDDDKPPGRYINLFQILEGQEMEGKKPGPYAKAGNYKGRLIWQAFGGENGDDEENSSFYQINSAFIGEPHKDAPEFVLQNIVVNLNNPKAAEPLDE